MARFIITGEYKNKATLAARKDLKALSKETDWFARKAKWAYTIASAYALRYAKNTLITAASAALADEKSQRQLNLTLENFAGASLMATRKAEEQITAMSKMYGIVDDQLRPAMARLARSTKDSDKALKGLELALNISKATGQDLNKVTNILARAYDGNLTGLTRLGVGMTKTALKGKKVDDIMADLQTRFAGFAKQELNTTATKFDKLTVAADNAKEMIGTALVNALTQVGGAAGNIDEATAKIENLGQATSDLIAGLTTKKNGRSLLDDLLSGFEQLAKPFQWIAKRIVAIGAAERKLKEASLKANEAIMARVNSYRRLELARLGLLKVEDDSTDTQKKTLEQLMAEEAARKAGFKLTEDLDSIQTVAAAKRLEESRQYKASVLDAAQSQFEAIKSNYDLLNAVWQTQLTAFDVFLAALKTKAKANPIGLDLYSTYIGSGATGMAPMAPPTQSNYLGFEDPLSLSMGYNQGSVSGASQPSIVVNVNAGIIAEQERLVSEIASAVTQNYRYGNSLYPAGYLP